MLPVQGLFVPVHAAVKSHPPMVLVGMLEHCDR